MRLGVNGKIYRIIIPRKLNDISSLKTSILLMLVTLGINNVQSELIFSIYLMKSV